MSSKLPKFEPPSAYTPFLRRFTDERALDLADTQALFAEVSAAHKASAWSSPHIIDSFISVVAERVAEVVP